MLFKESFDFLFGAIRRIESQLAEADEQQRSYLFAELEDLRQTGGRFFESWLSFEDRVQDLYDAYGDASNSLDAWSTSAGEPAAEDAEAELVPIETGSLQGVLRSAEDLRQFRRGVGYFDLLMFEESTREFEQLIAKEAELTVARLYLALAYIGKGQVNQAHEQLNEVLASGRDPLMHAAAHDAKAEMYANDGRFAEAKDELVRVLALKPQYADAWINLSVCHYELSDFDDAWKAATRAVHLDPRDPVGWRLLGASLFRAGNVARAKAAYREAASKSSMQSVVQIEYANLLRLAQSWDEAESVYAQVLAANARELVADALTGLAAVAMGRKDYPRAVVLYKKLLSLRPTPPQTLEGLGWALYGAGNRRKSEQAFQECLRAVGTTAGTLIGLARIAGHDGRFAEAQAWLEKVAESAVPTEKAAGFAESGRLHAQRGEYEMAERYLQMALAIDRRHADARLYLTFIAEKRQPQQLTRNPLFSDTE